jgi:hypothetical protein
MEAKSVLDLMRGGPGPQFVYTESGLHARLHAQRAREPLEADPRSHPLDRFFMNNTEYELYDLSNDPGELKNLYGQRPDIVDRLRKTLSAWAEPWVADAYTGPMRIKVELDTETIERLRAMGYVE